MKNHEVTPEYAAHFVDALKSVYPDASCALLWEGDPWKLLLMARLSAQCTDKRVNIVCTELFAAYPTPRALADAELSDVEQIVRPCGLFHVKARDIIAESRMLIDDFDGVLPSTMDELLRFPGVGRKVANLLLGDVYHLPAIVTDTHCIRIAGRFGLVPEGLTDPHRVEKILVGLIEPSEQSEFCHRIVQFGRDYCPARSPKCGSCPLEGICPKVGVTPQS